MPPAPVQELRQIDRLTDGLGSVDDRDPVFLRDLSAVLPTLDGRNRNAAIIRRKEPGCFRQTAKFVDDVLCWGFRCHVDFSLFDLRTCTFFA